MKLLETGEKKVICSNPDSIFSYFGWPSVTRLPDGTLAMVASGFRLRHICPFGKAVICYSRDEGTTWTRPAAVIDTPLDDRDGGIVTFANGRVIVTSFNNTIGQQRAWNNREKGEQKPSDDLRRCFCEAYLNIIEELYDEKDYLGSTYKISNDGGYTFGELMRSPVTAPHGPCRLNDGSLLYVGRRFSGDDKFDDGSVPFIQVCRMNERDEFEVVSSIENITDEKGELLASCEPHAIQLPDGKIIVHIRVQGNGVSNGIFTVYQSESTDGGKTFSKPHQLLDDSGGAPPHLYLHSGGTLISAYGYRQEPYGVRVMLSKDGGETWDIDYVLDKDCISRDLGYPASVELPDGRILTVYYQKVDGTGVIVQRIWELPL